MKRVQNYQFNGIGFQDVSKIVQQRYFERTFVEKSPVLSYQTHRKKPVSWSWKQFGHGKQVMLAFHGFNRGPDDFEPFSRHLGENYTVLAFDLFFHGKSYVEADAPFQPLTLPVLKSLLDPILEQYGVQEFEIMAYSFGGRLALNCVEIYQERIKGLYLLAPDGIRFNPGFYAAVQTAPGRALLKRCTHEVKAILKIMKLLGMLRIYNPKAIEFYMNHLVVDSMRLKVYHSWMYHRLTVPDLNRVVKIIRKEKIRMLLFFGKYDLIIPPKLGERFAKRAGLPDSLHILETGHRLQERSREICEIILRGK